ncbi:MAG: OmpA family protein, partial [Desulfuromonadaceae bacterium]|nr:OmpA family protein [Desulfuromonadaceae bacterium]
SIVLSQIGKIDQEKEQLRLGGLIKEQQAKIKVFDDKVAAIASLNVQLLENKKQLEERAAENKNLVAAKKVEADQLNAGIAARDRELEVRKSALATAESRIEALTAEVASKQRDISALELKLVNSGKSLDAAKVEAVRLNSELKSLSARNSAVVTQSQEEIQALKRSQEFVADAGQIGGTIKSGTDNMTVIFLRSALFIAPKNKSVSPEGEKKLQLVLDLLNKYPEFNVKISVHGFGTPSKNENAAATERMAKLVHAYLIEKGGLVSDRVEASGAGTAEPLYAKNNSEGNKRVEFAFVKK